MRSLINIVGYQAAWFACVLTAAANSSWVGTLIACSIVVAHVAFAINPILELKLAASALVIGLLVDSALMNVGLVQFNDGVTLPYLAPHWMLALWMAFGTTLNSSLAWLIAKPRWCAIFGAIGGPIAYYAGAKLGAISLADTTIALLVIAVAWGIAMYTLSHVTLHFVRTGVQVERAA